MKQLSGIDHMFLQMERGNQFMHVAGLGIYDPSTAPGGKVRFKDVLKFFAARIGEFPQFRRRLVTVPLALDRPYWVEDAAFDVEFHVRHIALPQPGDWRQLCIQVARLHSRPLDRSKPLWEVYVIEGLDNVDGAPPGSFALYTKMHHSLIDGESGSEITRAIHSLAPDAAEELDTSPPVRTAELDPSTFEMYSRALANHLGRMPDLARFSLRTASRVAAAGATYVARTATNRAEIKSRLLSMITGDLSTVVPKLSPVTRFSANVSAHRVFEGVALSMAEMKAVRQQVPDVTINDLFMTVVGGALNRYLAAKKELPASSLIAAVPMTLRGADKSQEGNRVGFTVMPVCSEIADPIERLLAIRSAGATAKRVTGAIGKDLTMNMLDVLPPPLSEAVIRNIKLPRLGLLVSNVHGPDVPIYMAGASLVGYLLLSIVIDGIGLNCTGFSYAGKLWICAVSCREMLPDPRFFADCLRESFEDLKRGAAAHAERNAPAALEGRETTTPARRKRTRPAAAARRRKVNGTVGRHLS
jgi:WS/DGAT/MGAT family acyltransferase